MNNNVTAWKNDLETVCETLKGATTIDLSKAEMVKQQIIKISEQLIPENKDLAPEKLKEQQLEFKQYIGDLFGKSYFFKRATTWPRGYAGDFETLEKVYQGVYSANEGIGLYLDNYFITNELARGIRERKRVLGNLILEELKNRAKNQRILNIACGSSREIFDIGKQINQYEAAITFLDHDKDAVAYSKQLMSNEGINVDNFEFLKFNALNLVSEEDTKSNFGSRDIIYSAGLFDYIRTDVLKKMIASLYSLLEPGGVLIAPFKDKNNYSVYDYHWLLDWSYFFQRSVGEVEDILEDATKSKVEIIKTESPAINFFLIRK